MFLQILKKKKYFWEIFAYNGNLLTQFIIQLNTVFQLEWGIYVLCFIDIVCFGCIIRNRTINSCANFLWRQLSTGKFDFYYLMVKKDIFNSSFVENIIMQKETVIKEFTMLGMLIVVVTRIWEYNHSDSHDFSTI